MAGLWVIVLSTTFLLHHVTAVNDGCPPLPISHFQWLNPDGSLVIPQASWDGGICRDEEANDSCGPRDKWTPIPDHPSCQFCPSKATLVCHGSDVYDVPNPASLPSTRISLYKMSGVGLISLLPKIFMGLSIQKLVIENSSISYLALETFSGVKSIKSLYLKNNMLDYIPQADYLFHNIKDLTFLSLEESGLKVLSSVGTANMYNLTYFSLAGNPLYTMDVFFLQNSGLVFFDLRNITFKIKKEDIKGTGLSKLPSSLSSIDLSRAIITSGAFGILMEQLKGKNIKTLNLSYLQLQFRSFWTLRHMKNSLQHLSLKGTDLFLIFNSKRAEVHVPKSVQFVNMKELNMENCNISYFGSQEIFKAFPNLTILSLAGNAFFSLDLTFFVFLPKLVFLDLRNNRIIDVVHNVEQEVQNLQGVDLSTSYFGLNAIDSAIFFHTLKNLQMVSFCKTEMSWEVAMALQNLHNLRYLDLSAALSFPEYVQIVYDVFSNINITLTELHFTQNNFKLTSDYPSFFSQLTSLESLDVSNNLIRELSGEMFAPSLKTLNASRNLITTWYVSVLKNESQLQCLDLSNNQITYITDTMVEDFYKLDSLSLDSNPLICHRKVVALVCSNIQNYTKNHNGIKGMKHSNQTTQIGTIITKNHSRTLTHVDWKQYRCYDLLLNGFRQFSQEKDCNEYYEEVSSTLKPENPTTQNDNQKTTTPIPQPAKKLGWNWEWTFLLVGPIVLVSGLGSVVYLKWWSIRCFFHRYISLKKARLLRKNGNLSAKPEVYYDVFVSYSDVDRAWVLDHLVPNIEGDRDVSLCFHERDFQVGMTILENIIDCMDHSHALLLVVSSAFIYSKWCQFEMHLAQYRLIETFRDHLILVLLEDIPRKARPQTLHHLMMSKTYLMWPQQPCKDNAYELFWRRLKRALRPNPNYMVPV